MFQDYSLLIAIVVFFFFVITSRSMIMNAVKKLEDEDKEKLLSSGMINPSQTKFLFLIGGLGVYYFAMLKYREYMQEIIIGFVLVIVAGRVVSFMSMRKKLVAAGLPDDYIKTYMNSSMLYTVGLVVFFFLLMKNLM